MDKILLKKETLFTVLYWYFSFKGLKNYWWSSVYSVIISFKVLKTIIKWINALKKLNISSINMFHEILSNHIYYQNLKTQLSLCQIISFTRIKKLNFHLNCEIISTKIYVTIKILLTKIMLELRLNKNHSAIKFLKNVLCNAGHSVYSVTVLIIAQLLLSFRYFNLAVEVNGFHRKLSHHSFRHWWQSPCCLALAPHVSFNQSLNISSSFFKTKNCPKTT